MLKSQFSAGSAAPHFSELDGMRGVLACLIMFFHLGLNTFISKATYGWLSGGRWELSVDFFFLLSGYVLSRSFSNRKTTVMAYLKRRVGRLAPVFLLSVLFMLALRRNDEIPLGVLIANLAIVQSILNLPSINFPAWTIPFELFFPLPGLLLIPYLNAVSFFGKQLIFAVLILGGMMGAALLANGVDLPELRAACGIGAGMMLYQIGWKLTLQSQAFLGLFLGILAIMVLSQELPATAILFYPASAACILAGCNMRTFLSAEPFQSLGRWSYSIYLLHIPILTLASCLLDEKTTHGIGPKLIIVGATFMLSAVVYRWIESPFIRSSKSYN